MRKNLSREGREKIAWDGCQRPTVFDREYLFKNFNGRKDVRGFAFLDNCNYSKVFFTRSNATPAEGLWVTLLYLIFYNTSGWLLLHVTDEEAAVDSHQPDKTVFEKENSI